MCSDPGRVALVPLVLICFCSVPALASTEFVDAMDPAIQAKIAPALLEQLASASNHEQIPIIIMMQERADIERLDSEINGAGLGRDDRSEIVVTALKNVAATSQPALREQLEARRRAGEVADVRPFWLINALALRAAPAIVAEIAARPDVGQVLLDGYLELHRPEAESPSAAAPDQAEIGLLVVNAPALWSLGYTGEGSGWPTCNWISPNARNAASRT